MEEDVEFRQGLPLDYLTYMGVQNSDKVINRLFCIYFSLPFSITITSLSFSQITHKINQVNLVCSGWPTQDKILLSGWESDEEANKLRPGRRCRGPEIQRLSPWLPSSSALSRYVMDAAVLGGINSLLMQKEDNDSELLHVISRRGIVQQCERSTYAMGARASYGCRRTHHYPDPSQSSACWMCQVIQLCIAFHSVFTWGRFQNV